MNKLLITINKDSDFNYDVYGYIIGIKLFSVNFNKYYDISNINTIKNKIGNKKLYISLNRLIFNNELEKLRTLLIEISKLDIEGLFFSDLGIYNIVKELKLDIKLIFNQDYFINNYLTCNWYYSKNIKDLVISNEIINEELLNITKNTKVILYKKIFGYLKLSSSKRLFISSYLKHINSNKKVSKGYISDNNKYPILEDKYGTYIFSDKVLMLDKKIFKYNINYYIIDTYLVDNKIIKLVLEYYLTNNIRLYNTINNKINTSTYFTNSKTIFRVKK